MDASLKRIVAFVIDLLLVTCVVTLITNVLPVDPYKEKYNEVYKEYVNIMDEANNSEDVSDDYKDKMIELNYDLYKYRVVSSSISIGALIIYFGVLQMVMGGQTVGKRLMNLRVVHKDDNKGVNIGNYLIRSIILNNIIFTIIWMIFVYIVSGKEFYYVTYIVSICQSFVYMINVLMVILRKDNRGLHDMLSCTKVIDLKPFVANSNEEEVKVIEVKKENKSKKKNKKSKK